VLPELERAMEELTFASRWILASFFIGLLAAMGDLLVAHMADVRGQFGNACVGIPGDVREARGQRRSPAGHPPCRWPCF